MIEINIVSVVMFGGIALLCLLGAICATILFFTKGQSLSLRLACLVVFACLIFHCDFYIKAGIRNMYRVDKGIEDKKLEAELSIFKEEWDKNLAKQEIRQLIRER